MATLGAEHGVDELNLTVDARDQFGVSLSRGPIGSVGIGVPAEGFISVPDEPRSVHLQLVTSHRANLAYRNQSHLVPNPLARALLASALARAVCARIPRPDYKSLT